MKPLNERYFFFILVFACAVLAFEMIDGGFVCFDVELLPKHFFICMPIEVHWRECVSNQEKKIDFQLAVVLFSLTIQSLFCSYRIHKWNDPSSAKIILFVSSLICFFLFFYSIKFVAELRVMIATFLLFFFFKNNAAFWLSELLRTTS